MRRARRHAVLSGLWLGAALSLHAQPSGGSQQPHEQSVVGLNVTFQDWDEDRPWAKQAPGQRSVVGSVVDDGLLLTTADVLDQATDIQLTTSGRSRQANARIVRQDRGVNLALLAVDEPAVLRDLRVVRPAQTTPTSGVVQTVRWNRQQFESVASRILRLEVGTGWSGRLEHAFLHMQTDMTGGGWAEPVFRDDELVGITASQSGQVSRAIPIEIIRAFLTAQDGGESDAGFPTLGVMWQVNRDPAVTAFLGQAGEPRGVIVRRVPWGSSGCGVLKPRDIVLELAGHAIDAEGYYSHARFGQLKFNHILAEGHRVGDSIPIRVLREGRQQDLVISARSYPAELDLVPQRRAGPPPYVIAGGLVLRELDVPYLRTWGKEWSANAPDHLLSRYSFAQAAQTADRRRLVLIASVLPSAYNLGYHSLQDAFVERVNGRPIGGLADVLEGLEHPRDRFHVLELAPDLGRDIVVLDAATLDQATADLLEQYRIPAAVRLSGGLPPGGGECAGDY